MRFRDDLLAAVARRDADFVIAALADNVEVSFGGDAGRADFIRVWSLERPNESPLWAELEAALALGCVTGQDGFYWAPAIAGQDIGDEADIFTAMLALPGAELRAAPRDDADRVASLDWDVVDAVDDDGSGDWLEVTLVDGRRGFVRRDRLRSVIDYRAIFERDGAGWRIGAFLAGD